MKPSDVVESHDVTVHTIWAVAWTGVLAIVAATIGNERPQLHWLLSGAALMIMFHVLLRVGRWAQRRDTPNVWTRRCTVFAWLLPAAFPAFAVWNAVTA